MKSGRRTKAGTGKSINVWNDLWLPNAENAQVTTPIIAELQHVTVNLLKNNSLVWDCDVISDTFNEQDAAKIIRISRSLNVKKDSHG